MITASSRFKQNAKAPVKTVQMRVTQVISEGTPIVWTSADLIKSIRIDANSTWLFSGAKKAEINLVDVVTGVAGETFTIELGIIDPATSEVDYITIGVFNAHTVDVNFEKGTTKITLFDTMRTAEMLWEEGAHTGYPKTVAQLAESLSYNIGCNETIDMTGLPNADAIVESNLWKFINRETYRDVINEIANVTATTAIINSENDLKFVPFATPTERLTYANLKKYKMLLPYGEINSVVLSRQPQNDDVALTDEQSIATNGLTEFKIINNEIADDDRETFIQPIFNAMNGITFTGAELETEGHGWYEIGDTLYVAETDTSEPITIVVTDYTLTFDGGGFKEIIKCATPDMSTTDYTTVGGIKKSIYNTEIKTDKQQQEITSIVSRQDQFEDRIDEEFTQVYQNIAGLTVSVQTTGGGNIIKNSVGYSRDNDNNLVNWAFTGSGSFDARTSAESLQAGAVSGNAISLLNGKLTQRVNLAIGQKYCLTFIAKKSTVGNAGITLTNMNDDFELIIPDQTSAHWEKKSLVFTPTVGYVDINIVADANVTDFAITDLMISQGDMATVWRQADGEILNTQVAVDTEGVRVKSSVYEGDETVMTPLEFAGYSNISGSRKKVFSLNRDTTEVTKIDIQQQIVMPPLKVIPLSTPSGWAFVKQEGA